MEIPKGVKKWVKRRMQEMKKRRDEAIVNEVIAMMKGKPQCTAVLGEMSKFHEHDQEGNCILRNWSNSEPRKQG